MARKRIYPPEFWHKVGRSVSAVAGEFEVAWQTIMNWLRQDDLDAGRRSDGLTSEETPEGRQLRVRLGRIFRWTQACHGERADRRGSVLTISNSFA